MYILQVFKGLMSFSQSLFSSRRTMDFPSAKAFISTKEGKLLPSGARAISCIGLRLLIRTLVTFSSLEAIIQRYPPPSWLSSSKLRVSLTFMVILFLMIVGLWDLMTEIGNSSYYNDSPKIVFFVGLGKITKKAVPAKCLFLPSASRCDATPRHSATSSMARKPNIEVVLLLRSVR